MRNTARAKNLYLTCIKTMFNAGKKEYNDYEKNIIRITNDPFVLVKGFPQQYFGNEGA